VHRLIRLDSRTVKSNKNILIGLLVKEFTLNLQANWLDKSALQQIKMFTRYGKII